LSENPVKSEPEKHIKCEAFFGVREARTEGALTVGKVLLV